MDQICDSHPSNSHYQTNSRRKRSPFFGQLIEAKKNFLALLLGKFTGGGRNRRPRRPRPRQWQRQRKRPVPITRQSLGQGQEQRYTQGQGHTLGIGQTREQGHTQGIGQTQGQGYTQGIGQSCRSVPKQICSKKMQESCSMQQIREGSIDIIYCHFVPQRK